MTQDKPGQANAAALGINLALQSDDGSQHRFEEVCDILESYLVTGFSAFPTPGIGGETNAMRREPNARINCYYDASSGHLFEEYLRRATTMIGVLCERFNQRSVGFELCWVDKDGQRNESGVSARNQPVDLINLVAKSTADPSEVNEVHRTLVVALHEGLGPKKNRMVFYKSPDWSGRVLVPSIKVSLEHPNADDTDFLTRAFWKKLPIDRVPSNAMSITLLPGGPKSDRFKFSLDRTKRWEGLKRYYWRVAWLLLPNELAATIGDHKTVEPEPLVVKEAYGLATLGAVKADHRNLAADWDVLHCIEDLFGGDLEIVPPNVNRS